LVVFVPLHTMFDVSRGLNVVKVRQLDYNALQGQGFNGSIGPLVSRLYAQTSGNAKALPLEVRDPQ